MPDLLPPGLAIAVATVDAPSSTADDQPDRHLIGVALFEAEEQAPGEFLYRYCVRTIPAGSGEAILIDWLGGRLPEGKIAIGWRLTEDIVPGLLEAAREAAPEDARAFVDALAAVLSMDSVDLADRIGEAAGRSFRELCEAGNIPCWPMADDEVLAAWALGREVELLGSLATNVVATWRSWVQELRPDDEIPVRFAEAVLANWVVNHDGSAQLWRSAEGNSSADAG